jgi:FKBP-type peptidyl-prolyl cis-trans isomerase FklB
MKKRLLIICLTVSLFATAQTKKTTTTVSKPKLAITYTPAQAMKNTKDSASYALGYRIAQSMKGQGLQEINMAIFEQGFKAGVQTKSVIPDSLIDICIKNYQDKMMNEKIAANRAAGKAFLDENAKKPGVVKMTSGLQYLILKEGTGTEKPTLKSNVRCHYHGTLITGEVFDSSVQRGEPISFPLNGVIKGWQDAVQLMTVGSKWRLFIPSELAYGERSAGALIGPGSTLIFDVELLGIN